MQKFAVIPRHKRISRYTGVLYTIILLSTWKYADNEVSLQNASRSLVPGSIKNIHFILIARLDCNRARLGEFE